MDAIFRKKEIAECPKLLATKLWFERKCGWLKTGSVLLGCEDPKDD
jgi:hypothetical protein